jgi:hypothetical protein
VQVHNNKLRKLHRRQYLASDRGWGPVPVASTRTRSQDSGSWRRRGSSSHLLHFRSVRNDITLAVRPQVLAYRSRTRNWTVRYYCDWSDRTHTTYKRSLKTDELATSQSRQVVMWRIRNTNIFPNRRYAGRHRAYLTSHRRITNNGSGGDGWGADLDASGPSDGPARNMTACEWRIECSGRCTDPDAFTLFKTLTCYGTGDLSRAK